MGLESPRSFLLKLPRRRQPHPAENAPQISADKLHQQQEADASDLASILEELASEDKLEQRMNQTELEQALDMKFEKIGKGSTKDVYGVKGKPDIVVKVDRSVVEPEDQKEEKDMNHIFHAVFPDHFPEVLETFNIQADGKRASGTITQRVSIQEIDTTVDGDRVKHPISTVEKICKETFGLPRFLDSNIGNGLHDKRTGTGTRSMLDTKTGAEVYTDDSNALTVGDLLKAVPKIHGYVHHEDNPGNYDTEAKGRIATVLATFQKKYAPATNVA